MPETKDWSRFYVVSLALLAVVVVVAANGSQFYLFNKVTPASVADLLTPLIVIALFLERAQEVFVASWREIGAKERDEAATNTAAARELALSQRDPAAVTSATSAQEQAAASLAHYKGETRRIAFLLGLVGGVLISAVGIRVLQPLVSWDLEIVGWQRIVFNIVDIVVTAGLLAGGSDGLHKLVSIFTDFFDQTRKRIDGKASPAAVPTPPTQ